MGIPGLLQALSSSSECCTKANLQDFAGQRLAVDASSWLHKSVYSIAAQYVEDVVEQSTSDGNRRNWNKCVSVSSKYMTRRCQELLIGNKIQQVVLVMDGDDRCPLKKAVATM